jgi:hypothetical protein
MGNLDRIHVGNKLLQFTLLFLFSITNSILCHDIAEILLKVELSTITQPLKNYFILRLAIK